jgi:hypothetical protein
MAIDLQNIIPGTGLGSVKFGLSREQVRQMLGEPDDIEQQEEGHFRKEKSEAWHYDDRELSLGFEESDGWRLGSLSVASEDYHLHGKTLIGLNRLEAIRALNNMGIVDLEYENDDPEQDMIASESTGIILWLDEGFVSEIQWSPLAIDDYTVEWPELGS